MNYFIIIGLFLDLAGAIILFWLTVFPKSMDDSKKVYWNNFNDVASGSRKKLHVGLKETGNMLVL